MFSFQANVMLEYSIDEADALLSKNLATATRNLKEIEEDLGFLRDQYTTTEVSILNVAYCTYSWDDNVGVRVLKWLIGCGLASHQCGLDLTPILLPLLVLVLVLTIHSLSKLPFILGCGNVKLLT